METTGVLTIKMSCPECGTEFDHNYKADDFKTDEPIALTCHKCGYTVSKPGTAFMEDFKRIAIEKFSEHIQTKY